MSAGFVAEPFIFDGVWLGFNSTFGAVGPFSPLSNHAETVGCKSPITAKAATMISASLIGESSFAVRLIVKFFQTAKNHLIKNPTRSSRF